MKSKKIFHSLKSLNSSKLRLDLSKPNMQPLPRTGYSQESLSSTITTNNSSEGFSEDSGNVKGPKKKRKWLKALKNPFKRKKRAGRNRSYSDSHKTNKWRKTHRKGEENGVIVPSPSESSFTSDENNSSKDCMTDESDQTITKLDEIKSKNRKSKEKESILSEDTISLKEKLHSAGESFRPQKRSKTPKMCNKKNKSVHQQSLARQSSPDRTSTCGSFKSISQDSVAITKAPQKAGEEKEQYQHKKQSPMSPFHKGLQNSTNINYNQFKSRTVPVGCMSGNHCMSNAENNSKFLTPPASPFWLQSNKQPRANQQSFPLRSTIATDKSIGLTSTIQQNASNPSSTRSTPRSRRRRRQRQQKSQRHTLSTPPPVTLPSNRKEESSGGSNKAHYLVVEVVYHGRSLAPKEKTMIQTQVAQLVDELLKKPNTLSHHVVPSPEKVTSDFTDAELGPAAYKECYGYQSQDPDKYFEAKAPQVQNEGRILAKRNEVENTERANSITRSNPNMKATHYTSPQYPFQTIDMNNYCPENDFNELVSKSQLGGARETKSSESIDYGKNPNLPPAYVQSNSQKFEGIVKNPSTDQRKSRTNGRNLNPQVHNGYTNILNYMNGCSPASIRPPVPRQQRNCPSRSLSLARFQPSMPFNEQTPLDSYYNRADILSSPALMSLKGYSSSITNESPYTTPAGTPARFCRPEDSSLGFCPFSEFDGGFDADDEGFRSPLHADMKISHISMPGELTTHQPSNTSQLSSPLPQKNSRSATSLSSSRSRKCKQNSTPAEHDAWWMPKEWAQERRIGAYGKEWTFEQDEEIDRQRSLEVARNPNVEKIRTCNFIRL